MSTHNIEVNAGTTVRLPTAGKYCDRDIVITATGGADSQELIDSFIAGTTESLESNALGITNYALRGFKNLVSVSFPLATTVGTYSFYECTNLTTCNIPNVTSIGGWA